MSIELSIVTYGNGDILREVFNAIAATMNSDSAYSTLIHLAIGLAGVWTMFDLVGKRSLTVLVRWFALYYLAFYVVFFPKTTVNIVDRVAQGKVYLVDNVPLGLAALASYTSIIGDSLTQLTEQNFSLPDDLRYGQTGMVMASNLVTAASTFQITDPVFENNMEDFINQCVFYDLLLDKYSAQDLLTTSNIWQFVTQNASPARVFMYGHTVVTCKDGVTSWPKIGRQPLKKPKNVTEQDYFRTKPMQKHNYYSTCRSVMISSPIYLRMLPVLCNKI